MNSEYLHLHQPCLIRIFVVARPPPSTGKPHSILLLCRLQREDRWWKGHLSTTCLPSRPRTMIICPLSSHLYLLFPSRPYSPLSSHRSGDMARCRPLHSLPCVLSAPSSSIPRPRSPPPVVVCVFICPPLILSNNKMRPRTELLIPR